MKNGSKWLTLVLVMALCWMTFVCAQAEDAYKIGILQYVEHPALDSAIEGFLAGLKDAGIEEGKNLTVDRQNPSADAATQKLMAEQLVAGGNDLLLGVATPAVQALSAETTETPILGTAVTDYVGAKLIASNEAPGINVSGTTDMNPIDLQIALVKQIVPEAKTLGICYTSNEINSQIQADLAKAEAEKLGLTVVVKTITAVGEVQQAIESLVGEVDVIYLPTDNILASAIPVVTGVTDAAKLPVIVGEANMCLEGGLATVGLNYYKLGYQTAAQAVRILVDGANPAEMPIESLSDADVSLNLTTAGLIGITFPQELLDVAVDKFE
ncbi:MAG: ABC transporter substrate-binding protein [Oscillospiraceae bacterium]|jgi:putative ABC transport system substrate-binding protein|nr:ABC transporter substrate-binding protein [Oscillospiraceae bacterium]